MIFKDRLDAGMHLSKLLKSKLGDDPIVLALPRVGIPLGSVIAKELSIELDAVIVRKLMSPNNNKVSIGAITWDQMFLNQDLIAQLNITRDEFQKIYDREFLELENRNELYRNSIEPPHIFNRLCILVDDGIATGASMKAAILFVRQNNPLSIIIASPVIPRAEISSLQNLVEDIVVVNQSDTDIPVRDFYENFDEVIEEDVVKMLGRNKNHQFNIPDNAFLNDSNPLYI